MQKLRIVTLRAQGDIKWSLNDGQIPNVRVVRVHVSTGYHRVEGNRRASRNGVVSGLPPEIPQFRFATFAPLYATSHQASVRAPLQLLTLGLRARCG
jgi:hypothetical protein